MAAEGEVARYGIDIAGVTYRIVVQEYDNRYFASWLCMTCTELAGAMLHGNTLDEAVDRAKVRVADHHELFHQKDDRAVLPRQLSPVQQ